MTGSLKIRYAEPRDVENLTVLKQQVWIATYAVEGIRKEFADYVLDEFTVAKTTLSILDNSYRTFVAELDGHLVGCLMINFNPEIPVKAVKSIPEITVIYVLERFWGKGFGQKLLDEALLYIGQMKYKAAWLSVYHLNERALNFYKKNNFKLAGIMHFEMDGNRYENKVLKLIINY